MTKYSQNEEQTYILNYFANHAPGHLLDIGANDGQTLSNSRALIEYKDWSGLLVEPSPTAFKKLNSLYKDNDLVECLNVAIANEKGRIEFYDMESHLGKGDTSLLSTAVATELPKWASTTEFKKIKVKAVTYAEIVDTYDFITIDCEGLDLDVLRQIDLKHTQMVCVEHNSVRDVRNAIIDYCGKAGLTKKIYECMENVIMAR
jgi:FkbM family methyltransferase